MIFCMGAELKKKCLSVQQQHKLTPKYSKRYRNRDKLETDIAILLLQLLKETGEEVVLENVIRAKTRYILLSISPILADPTNHSQDDTKPRSPF